jgi:hypothetical protein
MNDVSKMHGAILLHEYQNTHEGVKRRAEVHRVTEGYNVTFFKDNIWHGTRNIVDHSEQYAEDCAENFVMGIFDVED